ncbi:HET-domain-containing protein [Zalerion maritima]|uniref:HET-domain-containing protein n=1 Tax=Zalerion maritima TaxID=339359 RepID=A0AAD5RL13_9PEZI|nr:HET-domain-containing protein [Zalerion maritima]
MEPEDPMASLGRPICDHCKAFLQDAAHLLQRPIKDACDKCMDDRELELYCPVDQMRRDEAIIHEECYHAEFVHHGMDDILLCATAGCRICNAAWHKLNERLANDHEQPPAVLTARYTRGARQIHISLDFLCVRARFHELALLERRKKNKRDLEWEQVASILPNDSTGSDAALGLAKLWYDRCGSDHDKCRSSKTAFLPTRLLDIDPRMPNMVRLVELGATSSLGNGRGGVSYAALSYCWGEEKHHPPKTTLRNLQQHLNGLMRFDCLEAHRSEDHQPGYSTYNSYVSALAGALVGSKQYSPWNVWHRFVEEYQGRKITYYGDRLVALEGIVEAFRQFNPLCSEFLAGIWHSELPHGLLWNSNGMPEKQRVRPSESIAPSWSWLSCDGGVDYHTLEGGDNLGRHQVDMSIVFRASISGPALRKTGHIVIHGDTRMLCVESQSRDTSETGCLGIDIPSLPLGARCDHAWSERDSLHWTYPTDSVVYITSEVQTIRCRWQPDEPVSSGTPVLFMAIQIRLSWTLMHHVLALGLVFTGVKEEEEGGGGGGGGGGAKFRRVGLASFHACDRFGYGCDEPYRTYENLSNIPKEYSEHAERTGEVREHIPCSLSRSEITSFNTGEVGLVPRNWYHPDLEYYTREVIII